MTEFNFELLMLYHTIPTIYHTIPTFKDPVKKKTCIAGKLENACNQHFHIFLKCFLPIPLGTSVFWGVFFVLLFLSSVNSRLPAFSPFPTMFSSLLFHGH